MLLIYAEDDFDDYDFFVEAIKSIDPAIECINARDGQEVLDILEDIPMLPDFIFLDINMPNMDGKMCLKVLRQVAALNAVPIIMYSKSADKRDERHCLELGATSFIRKPFALAETVEKLREILKGKS